MSTHTNFRTDTTSCANSFLLLVMVASVLNIYLFESDAVSGYSDHKILYRLELVFNAESALQSPALSIFEEIPGNDLVEDRILPSHFYATWFGPALLVIQSNGHVNSRPFYPSHYYTTLFNVPHQNSDEDEAFILPVDVA